MKNTKIFQMIENARNLKAQMEALKSDPAVVQYLALETERKELHQTIGDHIAQYHVTPEQYKPWGLVERTNKWVTVKDVEGLAVQYPSLKDVLLGIINAKLVYYTK